MPAIAPFMTQYDQQDGYCITQAPKISPCGIFDDLLAGFDDFLTGGTFQYA